MKITTSKKKGAQSATAPRAVEQISAMSLQREMEQSHNANNMPPDDVNALNMLEDDFHMRQRILKI